MESFEIKEVEDFDKMRRKSHKPRYVLTSGIDFSDKYPQDGEEGFEPIEDFYGFLEGNGHTIKNLYINKPKVGKVGLFSNCGGTIENINFKNAKVIGGRRVGILSGSHYSSTIFNCRVTSGKVKGINTVGGITGYRSGKINKCLVSSCSLSSKGPEVGKIAGYYKFYEGPAGKEIVKENCKYKIIEDNIIQILD